MASLNHAFWAGKKVLVTGHTGFKGSWLCLWLQQLGAEVVGYALAPPTDPSLFEVAQVEAGMNSIEGDVRDLASLRATFEAHQPEIVFHLAAQPLVRPSYHDPIETYSTNVMGSAHLLEAVRQTPSVRVATCITSDKCYRNVEWIWGYREADALGGHDPYSSSKGCAELVIDAYRNSYFTTDDASAPRVAIASTRAGNVIGGGDWAGDRLVPDIMKAILAGHSVQIRNPKATRPWQHVLDPLDGYLRLAERLWSEGDEFAEAWNFGPSEEPEPVEWIVRYLAMRWEGARWDLDSGDHPHENTYLKLDSSKALQRLGWRQKLALDKSLDWITEWYQSYRDGRDMRAVCKEQIARYEAIESKAGVAPGRPLEKEPR